MTEDEIIEAQTPAVEPQTPATELGPPETIQPGSTCPYCDVLVAGPTARHIVDCPHRGVGQ